MNRLVLIIAICVWIVSSIDARQVQADLIAEDTLKGNNGSRLYFIDAHSQIMSRTPIEEIIRCMDRNGVAKTILSSRKSFDNNKIVKFADEYSDRIIPALRSKCGPYVLNNLSKFEKFIGRQLNTEGYKASAEILLYHAGKAEVNAPEINAEPNEERVRLVVNASLRKKWPIILHMEYAGIERDHGEKARDKLMKKIETMFMQYPSHPFALIHMGQLPVEAVKGLISRYSNVFFITSWANPYSQNTSQPWINMFNSDKEFKSEWARLITQHPNRFIFALDRVTPEHWSADAYQRDIAYFRNALSRLPDNVAHAVAHANAEKLWNLRPRK